MKNFKRTAKGINNQYLFHNVDVVIYLEGGRVSYNKEEVYSGRFTEETEDTIFWKNVFNKFSVNKKIKFKSIGSKTTLKDIASDIMNEHINHTCVAMDNEFDEILNQRIKHPNVFYTYGYSWENDVWNQSVIKEIIEEISAVKIDNKDIEMNFNRFLREIKLAVYADGYLIKKNSSFFVRKSGRMFCIECTPPDLPYIKKYALTRKIQDLRLKNGTLYAFGRRHSIDTLKFCYGHLLADYCYQLIMNYIKNRHSLPNIPKDIIYRMGINKYFQLYFDKGYIFEYYNLQFKESIMSMDC